MVADGRRLPFYYEDKQILENLLKEVSLAIKDSDASEKKETVKHFLNKVSEAFLFVTIGSSRVGKSTFLNQLFQNALSEKETSESTGSIREYRYGVSEATVRVNEYVTRIFRCREELKDLQVVDMQGVDQIRQDRELDCVKTYLSRSSVVFALFDARSVKDYAVWDLLEGVETRKTVFVLTKCDLAKPDVVKENERKLRQYMKEAGLRAPVFQVSSKWKESFQAIRTYVAEDVIGSDPVLTKQQENLNELKQMLRQLSESCECRRQQYESDADILNNINRAMDAFILNNQAKIDDLKTALSREINREIEAYENEVIRKLDPHKIRERFPGGSRDLADYLNLINEGYRKRMTSQVNRKTQETVQTYLAELEHVLERATGYLNKRKEILALKDKFYGSLAESKKTIVYRAATQLEVTKDYYLTLADASTELFMKLWKARDRRDQLVANTTTAGAVAGAVAGTGAGYVVGGEFMAAAGATTGGGLLAAGLWPVLFGLLGAVAIAMIAKKIVSAGTLPELEEKTEEAIADFRKEVAKNKAQMTEQILETIDHMFRMELENVDRSFSEFRMSVNIEGNNILKLEDRLGTVQTYMQQIEELERRCGLEG